MTNSEAQIRWKYFFFFRLKWIFLDTYDNLFNHKHKYSIEVKGKENARSYYDFEDHCHCAPYFHSLFSPNENSRFHNVSLNFVNSCYFPANFIYHIVCMLNNLILIAKFGFYAVLKVNKYLLVNEIHWKVCLNFPERLYKWALIRDLRLA